MNLLQRKDTLLNNKHLQKFFTLLLLLVAIVSARAPFYFETTLSVENSPELHNYYEALLDNLCYDVTSKVINPISSKIDSSYTAQISWQGKLSFFKIETPNTLIFPALQLRVGHKSFAISSKDYWTSASMSKYEGYIGFTPIWQFNTKRFDAPFHLLLVPQVGVANISMSGSSDEEVNVTNGRFGLGLSFQLKSNKKRKVKTMFHGLTVESGVTYDRYIKGEQHFGRIYGNNVGLSYDRRLSYPNGIYVIYCNMGYILKKPGR